MTAAARSFWRREVVGLGLVLAAVSFQAVHLAPELTIGALTPNDAAFHRVAAERLLEAARSDDESLLDPWVSEWSLGYPVWRSYQPLPHLAAAAVLALTEDTLPSDRAFAAWQYLLMVLLPLSLYVGARLLGLEPAAAGLASLLALWPNEAGDLGRYGLGYGATTWRGSGLYTQLFALHLLLPTIGLARRAVDSRDHPLGRLPLAASVGLMATTLSHVIFGYVAFVSTALLALVGPRTNSSDAADPRDRAERLVRMTVVCAVALVLLAWFVVPLLEGKDSINRSRYESAYKWDSFGAPRILGELAGGRLFDADRAPILTALVALGAVAAYAGRSRISSRLLALTVLWLALFFGRETWGHLTLLAVVPAELHMHRLQGAFQLMAVLLASHGLVHALDSVRQPLRIAGVVALVIGLAPLARERAHYLERNALWGDESLRVNQARRPSLDAALAAIDQILAERPGRVSAGKAATWGAEFKVGAIKGFAHLTHHHLDQVSFLYHSMSRTSDLMVHRNEASAAHQVAFGVRAVLAPADREMPAHLRRRFGNTHFAVYESSGEGYFGLVDIVARKPADDRDGFATSKAWLEGPLLGQGLVVALDDDDPHPALEGAAALPTISPVARSSRGRIVDERKHGEVYSATVALDRPCHVFVKITYHPDLVAEVDGIATELHHVTPGFGAVLVPAGAHEVTVRYRPGPAKMILLLAGVLLVGVLAWIGHRSRARALYGGLVAQLARLHARVVTPRNAATLWLIVLVLIAMRPLARGQLIDGHDALEYPTRLVEFDQVIGDHRPPLWAPDLGNGFGQPLFAFAPPLVYVASFSLSLAGLSLTDSLQLALIILHLAGAAAMYRLARRASASRAAGITAATAWLFAPYTSLDLFVRAAFAEAAAVAVAPAALLTLLRALDRPTPRRVVAAASCIALVVLGHNAAALLMMPTFAVVVLIRGFDDRRRLLGGAITLAGATGASAFFWLPALVEKQFVKTDLLRADFLDWRRHAVEPAQLLWSRWGHGLSGPGHDDGMSFAIGPVHLLLAAASAMVIWRDPQLARRREAVTLLAIGVVGALLATTWAAPVWSRIETLQYLAYPWRALMLPGLLLPVVAIQALVRLGPRAVWAIFALLVVVNLPHTEPGGYHILDDREFAPHEIARRGLNTTTREEYEPRWVARRPPYRKSPLRAYQPPSAELSSAPGATNAEVEVTSATRTASRHRYEVDLEHATTLEVALFYYPGWTATVDGKPVAITPVERDGTIALPMPAGEHVLTLELRSTPLRRTANWISLVSLLVGIMTVVVSLRPPRS